MLHFLICDDHALMRQALEGTILLHWPSSTVQFATDFPSAWKLASSEIDVCICDLKMPGSDPVNGIKSLMQDAKPKKLIAISGSCDQHTINAVLELGVHGLFDKSLDGNVLEAAIRVVLSGGTFFPQSGPVGVPLLTDQQKKVMDCLCQGKSNKEIAKDLSLSPSTVNFHVDGILQRLTAKNRAEAVSKFRALAQAG